MLHTTIAAALVVTRLAAVPQAVPVSLTAGVALSAHRTGATASLDVERPVAGPASIRIGVGYVARGLTDSAQACNASVCFMNGVDVRTDFLTFTALFVLSQEKPLLPYLAVGPYLAPRIGCTDVTVGDCDRVDTSDGGIVVESGAIIAVKPIVGVTVRYERALAPTIQIPTDAAGGTADLHYQTLSVALRVRLGAFGR